MTRTDNQPRSLSQKPVVGTHAKSQSERLHIVTHPAFRLGFLDAAAGRPLDHDRIIARIEAETPASALQRTGWRVPGSDMFEHLRQRAVEIAQYRYEEGRLLRRLLSGRVKGWGHPDYPPAIVQEFCRTGEIV